jgi:hypothetical protein
VFVINADMSNDCQSRTTIVIQGNHSCPSGYFELPGCAIPPSSRNGKGAYYSQYCYY